MTKWQKDQNQYLDTTQDQSSAEGASALKRRARINSRQTDTAQSQMTDPFEKAEALWDNMPV